MVVERGQLRGVKVKLKLEQRLRLGTTERETEEVQYFHDDITYAYEEQTENIHVEEFRS